MKCTMQKQPNNPQNRILTIKDIALIGVMIATLEVGKTAMNFLPNIEIVTLFIILYTLFFGKKTIYAIVCFVLLEGCIHGFGLWWIMYLYVWPLLSLFTWLMRKHASAVNYAFLSGVFGLLFGAFCSLPYLFIGGPKTALSWWVAGIPFDIVHCISNFLLCLVLFKPLHAVLKKIKTKYYEH